MARICMPYVGHLFADGQHLDIRMSRFIISLSRVQVDLLELSLYQWRLFSRTSNGNLWLAEEDAGEDNAELTIWNNYDVPHIN